MAHRNKITPFRDPIASRLVQDLELEIVSKIDLDVSGYQDFDLHDELVRLLQLTANGIVEIERVPGDGDTPPVAQWHQNRYSVLVDVTDAVINTRSFQRSFEHDGVRLKFEATLMKITRSDRQRLVAVWHVEVMDS